MWEGFTENYYLRKDGKRLFWCYFSPFEIFLSIKSLFAPLVFQYSITRIEEERKHNSTFVEWKNKTRNKFLSRTVWRGRSKPTFLFQHIGNSASWRDLSHRLRSRGTRSISSRFHFSLLLPSRLLSWLFGPDVNRPTDREGFSRLMFPADLTSRVSRVLISDGERDHPRERGDLPVSHTQRSAR